MAGMLLLALVMVNIPLYQLIGRRLFGTWDGFAESLRSWMGSGVFGAPWDAGGEGVSADVRLGAFLAGCAGAVIVQFFVIGSVMGLAH